MEKLLKKPRKETFKRWCTEIKNMAGDRGEGQRMHPRLAVFRQMVAEAGTPRDHPATALPRRPLAEEIVVHRKVEELCTRLQYPDGHGVIQLLQEWFDQAREMGYPTGLLLLAMEINLQSYDAREPNAQPDRNIERCLGIALFEPGVSLRGRVNARYLDRLHALGVERGRKVWNSIENKVVDRETKIEVFNIFLLCSFLPLSSKTDGQLVDALLIRKSEHGYITKEDILEILLADLQQLGPMPAPEVLKSMAEDAIREAEALRKKNYGWRGGIDIMKLSNYKFFGAKRWLIFAQEVESPDQTMCYLKAIVYARQAINIIQNIPKREQED